MRSTRELYGQTPPEIMWIIELFRKNKLSSLLFKCEHIFAGQNKNVDILLETDRDYERAGRLLEEQGLAVRLSEKIEKYKTMYAGFHQGQAIAVHLHREIAWHGLKALDKRPVFQRAQRVHPAIIIPSREDSILIHAAHVLFENFIVTDRERNYFCQLNQAPIDKAYISGQLRQNRWVKGFGKVLRTGRLSPPGPTKTMMFWWLEKLGQEPGTMLYLLRKAARLSRRVMSIKKKGCLMACSGANGSGKTTLAKKILEHYRPFTKNLGIRQRYHYFGWKPAFPLTQMLSFLFQKMQKNIFRETTIRYSEQDIPAFDLKQELLYTYLFGEFLFRYYWEIYPALRKGELVVCDRYYYDLYGQYPYARNSKFLKILLRLFPRPNFTYVLQADINEIINRKKTSKEKEAIEETDRKVLPSSYLRQQQENYARLPTIITAKVIDTTRDQELCAAEIMRETWKQLLRSV